MNCNLYIAGLEDAIQSDYIRHIAGLEDAISLSDIDLAIVRGWLQDLRGVELTLDLLVTAISATFLDAPVPAHLAAALNLLRDYIQLLIDFEASEEEHVTNLRNELATAVANRDAYEMSDSEI